MENYKLSQILRDKADSHQYLYHYTTVESLYKIIESGAFRFSRIDKVNDPVEGQRAKKSILDYYVSSFTHDTKESIPL
jgi:hypothetical protein